MSVQSSVRGAAPSFVGDLVRLARPKDWLKNVFVLMPLPFALASGATLAIRPLVLGIAAMCLSSSAIYATNDLVDVERDRLNPRTPTNVYLRS